MRVGRFAPSPSGLLHMGSLTTALASFLDIKKNLGRWSIRIDDLDYLRSHPNTTEAILDSLKQHGLYSDNNIIYQSRNLENYEKAISQLDSYLFHCICSRKSLTTYSIYPGTCRDKGLINSDSSIRIKTPDRCVEFIDKIKGKIKTNLAKDIGDFILVRKDKIFSYNLAAACDDGNDLITDVLRGEDLVPITSQQIFLMQELKLDSPEYSHIPVLRYADGTKLSKQSGAKPLNNENALDNIISAMSFLGLKPPIYIRNISSLIEWGIDNWTLENLPKKFPAYQHFNG